MNEIKIKVITINSREVAEMVGKRHSDLMRDIKGYIDIIDPNAKLRSADFFIESTYTDKQNQVRPCYELTKQGCEMVGNKLTGEKGILFTAEYVQRFNEMQGELQSQFQIPTTFADALRLAADQQEKIQLLEFEDTKNKQIIGELQPKATYYDLVLQNKSLLSVTKIAKDYGMSARKLNDKLHTLGIQFKQGDCWFLYQKHATKGYTQTKTHVIDDKSGKTNMYWTQKGRLFIYETLKQEGILPLIEREQDETAS